jgi:hypothetical protein
MSETQFYKIDLSVDELVALTMAVEDREKHLSRIYEGALSADEKAQYVKSLSVLRAALAKLNAA